MGKGNMNMKWDPYKSKWKAALEKGLDINLKDNDNVLYLGASSGTTVRQVSKLTKGIIFAVENSPEMAIELIKLAESTTNIAPIFCDARDVSFIKRSLFDKKINVLFQDIPCTDQVEMLVHASELVEKEALILFSLKTQSISQQPAQITFQEVELKLKQHFKIVSRIKLEPYHKKHYFFILKKKEL